MYHTFQLEIEKEKNFLDIAGGHSAPRRSAKFVMKKFAYMKDAIGARLTLGPLKSHAPSRAMLRSMPRPRENVKRMEKRARRMNGGRQYERRAELRRRARPAQRSSLSWSMRCGRKPGCRQEEKQENTGSEEHASPPMNAARSSDSVVKNRTELYPMSSEMQF